MSQATNFDATTLAPLIGAARIEHFERVSSTMDEAHRLAETGAPSGTVVVADEQLAGRGRFGRKWAAARGAGLWMTTLHRNVPVSGLDVLSLRVGLGVAPALDAFADGYVALKWPNDLLVNGLKLAGILVEARWRDISVEWVAVGIGINVIAPEGREDAVGLRQGTRRDDVLRAIFPRVMEACSAPGELTGDEVRAFAERDAIRDSRVVEPAAGLARGIMPNGALIVDTTRGRELFRRGSLVRAKETG